MTTTYYTRSKRTLILLHDTCAEQTQLHTQCCSELQIHMWRAQGFADQTVYQHCASAGKAIIQLVHVTSLVFSAPPIPYADVLPFTNENNTFGRTVLQPPTYKS
jgi:hypothetical protein